MRMQRWSVVAAAVVGLACVSCIGTSAKLNKVSLGMTKAEVIKAIGQPDSVSAKDGVEYLIYHWANPHQLIVDDNMLDRYFVRLVGGRVDAYGEGGDLGTSVDLRNR
jgi:hypothetical protein